MTRQSDSEPVFSDEDISTILKRAAELQGSGEPEAKVGFTLAELQNVASEAGIDPKYVATAASELLVGSTRQAEPKKALLTHSIEFVVEGEIDDIVWESMVAEIRHTAGETGVVTSWGRSREWALNGNEGVQAHVTATSTGGHTHVRVFWQSALIAVAVWVPFTVASIILIPLMFDTFDISIAMSIVGYILSVGVLLTVARLGLGQLSKSSKKKYTGLAHRLEEIATRGDVLLGSREQTATGMGGSNAEILFDTPEIEDRDDTAAEPGIRSRVR